MGVIWVRTRHGPPHGQPVFLEIQDDHLRVSAPLSAILCAETDSRLFFVALGLAVAITTRVTLAQAWVGAEALTDR